MCSDQTFKNKMAVTVCNIWTCSDTNWLFGTNCSKYGKGCCDHALLSEACTLGARPRRPQQKPDYPGTDWGWSTVTEWMINGQSWVMGYNRKIQCISEATSTFRLTLLGSCPAGGSSWNLRWWMAKRPTFELQTCKPLQATVSAFNAYLLSMRVSHDTSPSSFLSFTHSESPPKHLRSFHGSRRDKPHQSSNALSTFEFFHPSPKSEKLDSIFERSESLVFLQVRSLWWTSPSLSEWTLPQQPPQFSRSSWDYMTMLMLMPKYNRT